MGAFTEYVCGRYQPRTAEQVHDSIRDTSIASRLTLTLFNKGLLTPQEFLDVLQLGHRFSVKEDA